ncbi:MAG: branched-chain amino acid ABC transporter permease [Chloroflexi bacterium]|nr:branched-chain amino acid ABC transporter permease [Chloroflexota bacterium]
MELSTLWELFVTGMLRGGIYALMAIGLALVFGVMNIAQFAHGEFYMVGAYGAFFAATVLGLSPLPAILFAAIASFLVGVLVERIAFLPLRRRSEEWVLNAFLLTVGLSFVLQNAALTIFGPTYRGTPEYWKGSVELTPGLNISVDRIASLLIAIVAISAMWVFLHRTQTGRAIRAVAQDERGATLVGISLTKIHALTFGLSTALAGLAGASLLPLTQAYPAVGFRPLVDSWFVVMLVGLGNVSGSIVGGFIVGMLETASYFFLGAGWQDVITLFVLILILLFKPSGLFGSEVKGIWEQ